MQLSPSASLSNIVKHYLILESEKDIHLNYRLFSDGNPGIVFHFKNPLIQYSGNHLPGNAQPNSFVYGQITRYNDLISNGKLGMLVAVLEPYSIYSLLHIPAYELNNRIIKLADLFGQDALDVGEQILNEQRVDLIIRSVEKFLLKKLPYINNPDHIFMESLHLIHKHKGILSIEELLKKIPVTERQLERKFKEHIGTSPKKFSDIIKFQNFLKLLRSQPSDQKISDAVYDGGYYDQAHLNNYFKKTTGITPVKYKLHHHLLAINFIQLSANL
jgi:AraC-like DNA-binding protein